MKILAIEDSKLRRGWLHLVVYQGNNRLGVLKYQPASTRGAEHEVISFLADIGKLPKKYLTGYERPENLQLSVLDIEWIVKNAIKFEDSIPSYY